MNTPSLTMLYNSRSSPVLGGSARLSRRYHGDNDGRSDIVYRPDYSKTTVSNHFAFYRPTPFHCFGDGEQSVVWS
jgi:hypothetical protein